MTEFVDRLRREPEATRTAFEQCTNTQRQRRATVAALGRDGATRRCARPSVAVTEQLLLDKYAPHLQPDRDYRPTTDEELARTTVFRIDIEAWSGKKKEVAPDFPGAYYYGDHQPDMPRS